MQYLQAPVANSDADPAVTYEQSVVAFADAAAAARYVSSTKDKWNGCAERTVNVREKDAPDDPDDLWRNGAVSEHDGTVIWPISHGDDWSCTDLMAARANLVIEVEQCGGPGKTDAAVALVSKIGEKIDRAPRG